VERGVRGPHAFVIFVTTQPFCQIRDRTQINADFRRSRLGTAEAATCARWFTAGGSAALKPPAQKRSPFGAEMSPVVHRRADVRETGNDFLKMTGAQTML